jgi:2-polyprenyl-6-methoxyphenol hydroxylase-like FAD-dependent oxidoreductase
VLRKVLCVGGGPAGLYAAVLAKLANPSAEVEVRERNPEGATHGWGITFGEDLLDDLYRHDPESGRAIRASAILWADQVVRIGGREPVHIGGKYGFSMGRAALLAILTRRAERLGVRVSWESPVEDLAGLATEADLVVAADGAGSRIRSAGDYGTTITTGRNRYIWLGTERYLPRFTFAFERTEAGWIWFYAYPSTGGTSTCIVECSPRTWAGLGLDGEVDAGLRRLEDLFREPLGGAALLRPPGAVGSSGTAAPWLTFRHLRNATWVRDRVVLAGDAAHTTHFGIGSGTVLAVQDAVRLAESVRLFSDDVPGGLAAYDALRRAEVGRVQEQALRNMRFFEEVGGFLDAQDPVRFAYTLLDRRGDHPEAWRYGLHRATQIEPLRKARQGLTTLRRTARSVRRDRV